MMNRNEKMEIAKRLRHSKEMEMSRDDLEAMLESELSKPKAEMDTELVQQILELIEEAPSQEKQHDAWKKTSKRLKLKQWQPVVSGLTRFAAAIVILVAVLLATYGTAKALNWEFLLRWMKPFAETFMIYSGDDPAPTSAPSEITIFEDFDMEFTQQEFATLADCPDKIDGYPAKPVWMPERFAYLQGSRYSDFQTISITHIFKSDEGTCIFDISQFRDNQDATSHHYEKLPDESAVVIVSGHQVAFYQNTHNKKATASWVDENTHYFITGFISEEEIKHIIESMMK